MTPFSDCHTTGRYRFAGVAAAVFAVAATVASAGVGFNAPVKYAVGGSPFLRVVADFNGDGKPDLASSDATGNTVEVLMNNGSSGFTVASYAVGNQPTNVVSCDTNGDGKPDLIVGNRGSNSFSVLINQGFGVFAPAIEYPIGETPVLITCSANTANTFHVVRVLTASGKMNRYTDAVGVAPVVGTFALASSYAVAPIRAGLCKQILMVMATVTRLSPISVRTRSLC